VRCFLSPHLSDADYIMTWAQIRLRGVLHRLLAHHQLHHRHPRQPRPVRAHQPPPQRPRLPRRRGRQRRQGKGQPALRQGGGAREDAAGRLGGSLRLCVYFYFY
jgi:hypothetical protein